jgi:hypothetical protein
LPSRATDAAARKPLAFAARSISRGDRAIGTTLGSRDARAARWRLPFHRRRLPVRRWLTLVVIWPARLLALRTTCAGRGHLARLTTEAVSCRHIAIGAALRIHGPRRAARQRRYHAAGRRRQALAVVGATRRLTLRTANARARHLTGRTARALDHLPREAARLSTVWIDVRLISIAAIVARSHRRLTGNAGRARSTGLEIVGRAASVIDHFVWWSAGN